MIEIYLLEQLEAFERCGTLSQAAEELHISQPALSRSMKKLEEEMGVPLFDRAKSKIALNETGQVAAGYARRVLEADREMIERTVAFERSRRTIAVGSCASLPVNELLPAFQECFWQMAITTEITSDEKLLWGLKHGIYHLTVLHEPPGSPDIFSQKYMEERLCITIPKDHILADRERICFHDLQGMKILAHGGAGFWLDICRQNLKDTKLLVQDSMEMLSDLVDASTLPFFNSDRAAGQHVEPDGRVTLPVADEAAHVTYYLACLDTQKGRYRKLFQKISR